MDQEMTAPTAPPGMRAGGQAASAERGWPIFVVSLADAEARRAPLLGRLASMGLEHEVVAAVDGRRGLPPEYERYVDRARTMLNLGRRMADAEYACTLSHHFIYRRVVDEGLPGAIVLEDDAIVQPGFAAFVASGAYRSGDLILLDYGTAHIWPFSSRALTSGVKAGRISLNPSLGTGYSVSAEGCRYLAGKSLPITGPADWPCDIVRLGAWAAYPRLVDHPAPEFSHIQTSRLQQIDGRTGRGWRSAGRLYLRRQWRSIIKRMSVQIS
jgi:glycosyl transferase family 25